MAFFYSFTDSLRQKWLNFYQANRDWITLHMQVESVYTPDGGKRPPSYLILGVANALEPKLAQLMLPFSKLNADADTLIEVLDLHFDPEMALGNRIIPPVETDEVDGDGSAIAAQDEMGEEPVDEFDREIMVAKEFLTKGHSTEMSGDGVSHTEGVMGEHEPVDEADGYQDTQDRHRSQAFNNGESGDEFGEISFDADTQILGNHNEENLENLDTDDDSHQFSNVLMDVWGEESSVPDGARNQEQSGENELENAFDDTEIANLFPET